MSAAQKVRNVLRGLVQRYGTENIKRRLWNYEYGQGRWQCLDTMGDDCVYPYVHKHANNGSILDLGCGPGAVGIELNVSAYQSYTGVDICDVAVDKARTVAAADGRSERNSYVQWDIQSYVPNQRYDVILFGDSLYYFTHQRIDEILERYSAYLEQDGVFIVRSWLAKQRHRTIFQDIENNFAVVEKYHHPNLALSLIVFRPPVTQTAATSRQ